MNNVGNFKMVNFQTVLVTNFKTYLKYSNGKHINAGVYFETVHDFCFSVAINVTLLIRKTLSSLFS